MLSENRQWSHVLHKKSRKQHTAPSIALIQTENAYTTQGSVLDLVWYLTLKKITPPTVFPRALGKLSRLRLL